MDGTNNNQASPAVTDNPDDGGDAGTSDDRGPTASDALVDADRPPALPPPDRPAGALPSPRTIDPITRGLPRAYKKSDARKRVRSAETVLYDLVAAHRGPITQVELGNRTDLAPTTISSGLRTLEEEGLISRRRYGKTKLVQLRDADDHADTDGVEIPRRP